MKKDDFMSKNNLTVRPVNEEDLKYARTDYQRCANYIISNGKMEFFSNKATLNDMIALVNSWKEVGHELA